jgi:hypothetical protein
MNKGKGRAPIGPIGLSTSNEKKKRVRTAGSGKSLTERTSTRRRIVGGNKDGSDIDYDPDEDIKVRKWLCGGSRDLSKNLEGPKLFYMPAPTVNAKAADSANGYPKTGESSHFSQDLSREPIWLLHLLALFNCDSIPKILFSRASKALTEWNNNGELVHVELNCLGSIHPDFNDIARGESVSWLQRYTSNFNRKEDFADLIDSNDLAVKVLEIFSNESQLSILTIVISAWPEPWCEIVWEAVEGELWEAVESTCLPLLGVISLDEIKNFVTEKMGWVTLCLFMLQTRTSDKGIVIKRHITCSLC